MKSKKAKVKRLKIGVTSLTLLFTFSFLLSPSVFAAFTEFYCDAANGSNLNSGSTTASSAAYTSTNGGWNSGTGVFTPTSGNPSLTVSVGNFASVYTDGASVTGFVARVTAVSSTTITTSTTAKSGTAPTTAGTGITCKVGGAWKGPNGTNGFPFGVAAGTMTNSSGDMTRINGVGTSNITSAMTHGIAGPIRFQGYTATAGDGGKWTIDGGTSGTSYVLLTINSNAAAVDFQDMIFQNNGATGSANGITMSGGSIGRNRFTRVIINSIRGTGLSGAGAGLTIEECEFYACNQSNGSGSGGLGFVNATYVSRSIFHDNSGSLNAGAFSGSGTGKAVLSHCLFDTNGKYGFSLGGSTVAITFENCDFYNNPTAGLTFGTSTGPHEIDINSCNFVKNGWGIEDQGTTTKIGVIRNCGFGTGTQANSSGDVAANSSTMLLENLSGTNVTYASGVTPWVDPANGDFRINLAAAKGAGRGSFTQTASSYAGAVGYPDIGAAQHSEASTPTPTPAQTSRIYGE